jgi:hypothetical protein
LAALVIVVDEHFSVPLWSDNLGPLAMLTDQQSRGSPDVEIGDHVGEGYHVDAVAWRRAGVGCVAQPAPARSRSGHPGATGRDPFIWKALEAL